MESHCLGTDAFGESSCGSLDLSAINNSRERLKEWVWVISVMIEQDERVVGAVSKLGKVRCDGGLREQEKGE